MARLHLFLVLLLVDLTTFLHSANAARYRYRSCSRGWLTYQGSRSCYRLGGTSKKWMEARRACLVMGGDLVKISSAQENSYVALLARTIPRKHDRFWIGLVRGVNNKFMWIDGTRLSGQYSNWYPGEPNNNGEKCGEMFLGSMKWNDANCALHTLSFAYICEKERSKCCN